MISVFLAPLHRAGGLALPGLALVLFLLPLTARAVEVQRVVSPGGIEAWLVEDHGNPLIAMEVLMNGGAALDPQDKQGVATLASSTIDEGAGELDSRAFREELENLNIGLSFDAGTDTFSASVTTLTEHRDRAFELLRLSLSAPRLDKEPVERIRGQLIAADLQEQENPRAIAGVALRKHFFAGHPYAKDADGTADGLAAIAPEDIRAYLSNILGRDNLYIGVAGDITPEELGRLLDETFGGLPETAPLPEVERADPAVPGGLAVIERDIPQSIVSFGHEGIGRDDPDYYAAMLVNHILGGGGFSSRLTEEVRVKRGLAYGVYSYLAPYDRGALVLGGVATQNERVAQSIEIVRAEWARMATEGPTAEELEKAKKYLTGSYALRFSSSGGVAGTLSAMMRQDLGIDYIDRRSGLIEAVTLEDAKRVAARLLKPESLAIVVVGQPVGVEPSLELNDTGG